MIIRCPQCEHSRSIPENKIPPTAELATCPRCKHRFRFRILPPAEEPATVEETPAKPAPAKAMSRGQSSPPPPAQEVMRPQSAVRESVENEEGDLWDAVDALGQRWQAQVDTPVADVRTPAAPAPQAEPQEQHRQGSSQPDAPESRHARQAEPPHAPAAQAEPSAAHAPAAPAGQPAAHTPAPQAPQREEQPRRARPAPTADSAPATKPVQARLEIALPDTPRHNDDSPAPRRREEPFAEAPITPQEETFAQSAAPRPERAARSVQEERRQGKPAGPKKITGPRPAVFPYADDGPPPEERVEQHMRMLQDPQAEARPTRHLGMLKEFAEPGAQDDAKDRMRVDPAIDEGEEVPGTSFVHEALADSGIPWENPAKHGWVKGFVATLQGAMFRAPEFFAGIRGTGSLVPGYLFFLIMGYVAILSSLAWVHATAVLLPPDIVTLPDTKVTLPLLLLMAPLALGLMLLLVSGCIRVFLRLCAPSKADFARIYKVVAYSFAPLILGVVPVIGPGIGVLWFLASLIIGCRHALGLSWGLAVTVPLLPACMLIGGIAFYFL